MTMNNDTNKLRRGARLATLATLAALAAATFATAPAQAVVGPLWDVRASWGDTICLPAGKASSSSRCATSEIPAAKYPSPSKTNCLNMSRSKVSIGMLSALPLRPARLREPLRS